MSRSSLGVVLRGLPARGRSVTFPVWRKRCITPPSGNASATTHKTSTVDITSSPCSIWLVTWSFGMDYSHMETGPLVSWKSVQVQLTVKGKTTPDSYTPIPKSSSDQNVFVLKWSVSLAPNPCMIIPWPAMSPDMNPIEHVWDFIGQQI
jgi:hypothetical protein